MIASIVSGILIGTSYIPFPPWAILFAMAPLWLFWVNSNLNYKKVFLYGFITQFVLSIIGFHWIIHTVVEFGQMPYYIGVLALIGFSATQNLHIPIAGVIAKTLKTPLNLTKPMHLIVIGILTATIEGIMPMIFDWNFGYTWLYSKLPIYQMADTVGVQGLSFLTFIYNALFAIAFLYRKQTKKLITCITIFLVTFVSFNTIGLIKQKNQKTDSQVRIGVVQANIGNMDKQMSKYQNENPSSIIRKVYEKYFELTKQLLSNSNPDFVVWPEASFPKNLNERFLAGYHQSKLVNFIKETNTVMLVGGFATDIDDADTYYNSIFLFDRDAKLLDIYRKTYLLAFGEYLPGTNLIPALEKWLPQVSHFSRGTGPKVTTLDNVNIGYQICYEGLYPEFSAQLAQKSADVIVNVTNDSWFGHTIEPIQHLYMTMARAIETRVPIVRSTNTGISSAILADGTFLENSPEESEWTKEFVINYNSKRKQTFFTKIHKYLTLIELITLVSLITVLYLNRKTKKAS